MEAQHVDMNILSHSSIRPPMRIFLKKYLLKLFGRKELVEHETYYHIPRESIGGIFSLLLDGLVYDRDWQIVEGFESNYQERIDNINKMTSTPVTRVMHLNCGKHGCIWVMSDGTSINMTDL